MVTKEYLEQQVINLTQQKEQYAAQAAAASGAIELLNHLIEKWDNSDALTIPEFEEVVGGKVQEIKKVD